LGTLALAVVLWGAVLFVYLRLTAGQSPALIAGQPEPLAAVAASPTSTPDLAPTSTLTPTTMTVTPAANATALIPPPTTTAAATAQPTREPTEVESPSPEADPSPTVTPASLPSPTLAETPAIPADTPVPSEATGEVSFASDVLPIFERRCVNCHGGEKTEEGLVLKSHADVITGSWNGPVVEPGNAEGSFLVEQVVKGKMPKKGPRLLPSEIRIISNWIQAGAPNN
jgi:mono/diheme cytochrome c family protein